MGVVSFGIDLEVARCVCNRLGQIMEAKLTVNAIQGEKRLYIHLDLSLIMVYRVLRLRYETPPNSLPRATDDSSEVKVALSSMRNC